MWDHTAIFLTWDEWGGFYDHMTPPVVDDEGFGFRVPLLTISPYAARGVIDDEVGEFSTPLRFISDNWGLDPLTPRIARTHNFEHVFDFKAKPRPPDPRPTMKGCEGHPFEWIGHSDDWPAGIPSPIRETDVGFLLEPNLKLNAPSKYRICTSGASTAPVADMPPLGIATYSCVTRSRISL